MRRAWRLLPLGLLPFAAAYYGLLWWLGFPAAFAAQKAKADSLFLIYYSVFAPICWLYDLLYLKRAARKLIGADD